MRIIQSIRNLKFTEKDYAEEMVQETNQDPLQSLSSIVVDFDNAPPLPKCCHRVGVPLRQCIYTHLIQKGLFSDIDGGILNEIGLYTQCKYQSESSDL